MYKINLAIFLSGEGTNLISIAEKCLDKDYPAQISLVICDRKCNGYYKSLKLKHKTNLVTNIRKNN